MTVSTSSVTPEAARGAGGTAAGGRLFWTFLVTSVAAFMVSLDNLVVTNALPSIRRDLGADSPAWSGPSTPTR